MTPLEQALVLVDLDASSRVALAAAKKLRSSSPQLRIQLAHILPSWHPALRSALFPYAGLGDDEQELLAELHAHTLPLLNQHLAISDPDAEHWLGHPRILSGPTPDALQALLPSLDLQIILAGACSTRAHHDSLGSTASHLLRLATCPVLLLKPYESQPSIQHILCAIDLSDSSHHVLSAALSLAIATGASLETTFILPDPQADDPHGLLQSSLRFEPKRALERAQDKINALIDRSTQLLHIPFPHQARAKQLLQQRHIALGDPAPALLERAHTSNADLIAFSSKKTSNTSPSLLGRTAWQLARSSHTHLLFVPTQHHEA
jgi:nucleotide-binding universal stress UspA family protein